MDTDRSNRDLLGAQPPRRSTLDRTTASISSDARALVVRSEPDLQRMGAYLLWEEREHPVVALAPGSAEQLVLSPDDVRAVVGPLPRIYLIAGEEPLRALERLLGRSLALPAGTARIWWPGLTLGSDPNWHPIVLQLFDECHPDLYGEFARAFDLSRPVVRHEISLIDDLRRKAEDELVLARGESQRRAAPSRHASRGGRDPVATRHTGASSAQGQRSMRSGCDQKAARHG
jgi:hypothetical protein